jgi:hypothetical protein
MLLVYFVFNDENLESPPWAARFGKIRMAGLTKLSI